MSTPFRIYRNLELSLVYDIRTALATDWTGVNVVIGYPNLTKTNLPIVSIRLLNKNRIQKEIGSTSDSGISQYNIMVDIFAQNEPQRLDLASYLEDLIVGDFVYYTHSRPSGGGDNIDRASAGKIVFSRFLQNSKLDFAEDTESYEQHRHILNFVCRVVLS